MADKVRYEVEVMIKTSAKILFPRLSTPDGLAEWFCDDVDISNDNFVFNWGGSEEIAKILNKKNEQFIKFQWEEDADSDYFFEFRLEPQAMTGEILFRVTDFASEDEVQESRELWEQQISDLKSNIGLG